MDNNRIFFCTKFIQYFNHVYLGNAVFVAIRFRLCPIHLGHFHSQQVKPGRSGKFSTRQSRRQMCLVFDVEVTLLLRVSDDAAFSEMQKKIIISILWETKIVAYSEYPKTEIRIMLKSGQTLVPFPDVFEHRKS